MSELQWELREGREQIGALHLDGRLIRPGARVRLNPTRRGDILDLALAGQEASVHSVEQDVEGAFHVVVVLDSDPGRAIGPRAPGHRFFFSPNEVTWLSDGPERTDLDVPLDILIAGIGNVFLGDDGFGVEVAQRLARRTLPAGVRVHDFGIRGYDLAFALMDAPKRTILVDACPRGLAPGTIVVLEPDLSDLGDESRDRPMLDAHDMNPLHVLRLARSLGAQLHHVLVVGCEPETLGPDEGAIGLSDPVSAAVDVAMGIIEGLITRLRDEHARATHASPIAMES